MDIKSKKFNLRYSKTFRTIVFILCVITFMTPIVGASYIISLQMEVAGYTNYAGLDDIFWASTYRNKEIATNELHARAMDLVDLIKSYRGEAEIKEGAITTENNERFRNEIDELYEAGEVYVDGERIIAKYPEGAPFAEELWGSTEYKKAFFEMNKDAIEKIKFEVRKEMLREYYKAREQILEQEGIKYFISDGHRFLSNLSGNAKEGILGNEDIKLPREAEFSKYPVYVFFDGSMIAQRFYGENGVRESELEQNLLLEMNDNLYMGMAFDSNFISLLESDYNKQMELQGVLYVMLASSVLCLFLFIYLLYSTGATAEGTKLYGIDRMWTEIQLLIIGLALGVGIAPLEIQVVADGIFREGSKSIPKYLLHTAPVIAILTMGACIGLWYVLSLTRLLKAKQFIKNSLTYKLCHMTFYSWGKGAWNGIKAAWCGSSLQKKLIVMGVAILICFVTVVLIPLGIILMIISIYFAMNWSNRLDAIIKGAEEVKNGNLSHQIPVREGKSSDELDRIAHCINQISEASNIAVKNELKNQRMKTELISNVSHDLKTPLTSIISYIDLLKKENIEGEKAKEYIEILEEKADRLRRLTEDLFEAAKASSGAMHVSLEKVELMSLINQGLGEMNSRIEESELEFIVKAPEEKYFVIADGQLLWRIVENLLTNVLKYAMKGSRVYIDLEKLEGKNTGELSVVLSIKNISATPLNIPAEELMERFTRGDESRNTEGSGLGLAIAKDLAKLQGGWMDIIIDGDLFKAQVMLQKATEEKKVNLEK